jgi:hypothetical protein
MNFPQVLRLLPSCDPSCLHQAPLNLRRSRGARWPKSLDHDISIRAPARGATNLQSQTLHLAATMEARIRIRLRASQKRAKKTTILPLVLRPLLVFGAALVMNYIFIVIYALGKIYYTEMPIR